MRFERDSRAFEEDHLSRPIVFGGVPVIRVVKRRKVRGHADRIASHRNIPQHLRIPDAFLALAVRSVVIQVAELAQERALANSWSADDPDEHQPRTITPPVRCRFGETSIDNAKGQRAYVGSGFSRTCDVRL